MRKQKHCSHTDHKVLLISGHDPSTNAGLLRDFATCLALGQPVLSLPTAWTAQNDRNFFGYATPSQSNFEAVWKSFDLKEVAAVKIGMLGNLHITRLLIQKLRKLKALQNDVRIVWDPVFSSSSKGSLATTSAVKIALDQLLPLVDVITPNAIEACHILKINFDAKYDGQNLALKLKKILPKNVALYLKGGHLVSQSKDWLMTQKNRLEFSGKVFQKKVRGTGCILSSAIACGLAKHQSIEESCENAKGVVQRFFE